MKIFRTAAEIPAVWGPTVVTIGNFDGVHAGHRAIMRRAAEIARTLGLLPVVMTFDPHPAQVLAPERAPKLLMTINQRLRRIEAAGIGAVWLCRFSPDFAKLTPEQFARNVLAQKLRAQVVLVGEDFRFGCGQSGSFGTLRELGQALGFAVEGIGGAGGVERRGARISSTAIRNLIAEGRVSRACRMLEAPFAVEGEVVRGHGIGSRQTVPTLNLRPFNEILPRQGVYVTRTRELAGTREWASITNVGVRPTFGGEELTIETFLLDPLDGATPEKIEVNFLYFVREEKKFAAPEALKAQIMRDIALAGRLHRRLGRMVHAGTRGIILA